MKTSDIAAAELRDERKQRQIDEAKLLLKEKQSIENDIKKIDTRLIELDDDADPIDMDDRLPGDQIKIALGRQFIKR